MKKLTPRQRQIAIVAAAAVALYLVYRWRQAQNAPATDTTGTPAAGAVDPTSSDYATLAGQEQSDMASLQQQLSELMGQEQSDVASINATEQQYATAQKNKYDTLTNTIAQLTDQLSKLVKQEQAAAKRVAELGAGVRSVNRAAIEAQKLAGLKVAGARPAPFGHTKPQAPKGMRTIGLGGGYWAFVPAAHGKPRKHASSANTHVAHPNGNHNQQSGKVSHPNHETNRNVPKSKTPGKPSKPKASGARR